MTHKKRYYLLPLAWLYILAISIRNTMFDWGLLPSKTFPTMIICVGNVNIGGTGKTPFIEYLIETLKKDFSVAVLSRGYKRKTKGFFIADEHSNIQEIGDEPYQIKKKYHEVLLAVDGNRRRGIRKIIEHTKEKPIDVILLDDGFQHRYVNAPVNILLMDYNNDPSKDYCLPVGTLRETFKARYRANVLIYTKCNNPINDLERKLCEYKLDIKPYQKLYFTKMTESSPMPIFPDIAIEYDEKITYDILGIAGVANPSYFFEYTKEKSNMHDVISFRDHHAYKITDFEKINHKFTALQSHQKIILTTEKDAYKIAQLNNLSEDLKAHLFYLSTTITFVDQKEDIFKEKITRYISKNRNNTLLRF